MNTSVQSKPRILVIDDNPAIHDDFHKILISAGDKRDLLDAASAFFGEEEPTPQVSDKLDVQLDSAHQGEEGYRKVRDAHAAGRPYTLAFCDMRMPPGWDGLTTIENLWKADPNLQVVICSAYSDNTWSDISKRLGLSDRLLILKKPFDNAEVLQIVVALIEKRRLIDAASTKRESLERTVTERTRHLREARKESEQLLAAIDSMMVGTDVHGIVQRWNENAVAIFGIRAEDAMGTPLEALPIQWETPGLVDHLLHNQNHETSMQLETSFPDPHGVLRVISFSSYPVVEAGIRYGTLILGTDVTEHRVLEQQLQNAQRLESVGQLAAGVAHEINTPMQYLGDNLAYLNSKFDKLIGYLQSSCDLLEQADHSSVDCNLVAELREQANTLSLKKLYTQIPQALADSIDGVEHVSRIIRAMKELSHPGGEEASAVDINRALETTIAVSTNEWKYVAKIETDLDPSIEPVLGYPGELNQVFLNLIVNAAHAISDVTAGGSNGLGNIHIRSSQHQGFVKVEISDNGGGIPESIRGRVFDPFFTTKEVGKGTGQGLAIAHTVVVQRHAGKLSFDVEEGVGTTFVVDLPTSAMANSHESVISEALVAGAGVS
ncbi:Sporulation kinase E [Rosistilla carotiformis]|uniref:histidine kinase n=1 Tax=Rosistilla carotiformis TaxID=2528017 RepID=A0A518JRH6_9BACT|nr:ATP-binding protein [Rosistilla carotiformis]QDV68148.1 Sporulation kinase E [Rosistilla carotiformis]